MFPKLATYKLTFPAFSFPTFTVPTLRFALFSEGHFQLQASPKFFCSRFACPTFTFPSFALQTTSEFLNFQ
jgi:hypothetical protein